MPKVTKNKSGWAVKEIRTYPEYDEEPTTTPWAEWAPIEWVSGTPELARDIVSGGATEGGIEPMVETSAWEIEEATTTPITTKRTPSKSKANASAATNVQNQQPETNPFEIDPNRELPPMVDPIAYRKDYDVNNIIQQDESGDKAANPTPQTQSGNGTANSWVQTLPTYQNAETIYWKTWAQTSGLNNGVVGNVDVNSPFRIMEESRRQKLDMLVNTPVETIAAALEGGVIPWDMQAIVDYKTFYPSLYAQVEKERKKIKGQGVVDALTNWDTIPTGTNSSSAANNEIADFAASNSDSNNSMMDILKDIQQTLSSNKSADAANSTMADIEEEMALLTERLQWLRKEANEVFKWDAPDYIVNAYINNRTQEIQSKLKVLSDRYKYASNRYDKEVANTQWEKEYDLKARQVAVEEDAMALKRWQAKNWIDGTTETPKNRTSRWLNGKELPMTSSSRAEIEADVDALLEMLENGQLWDAQCAEWIQRYYFPMLWINLWSLSSYESKLAIRNEDKSYTPKKWDLIILSSATKPENWHMGIVTWVTEDGDIMYLDWNGSVEDWEGTEKAQTRWIKANSSKIQWYYNATKSIELWNWITIDESWYSSDLWFNVLHEDIYEKINSWDMNKSEQETQAKRMWITLQELWRRADNFSLAKAQWYKWYKTQENADGKPYNPLLAAQYMKYSKWEYSPGWLTTTAKSAWQTEAEFWESARAYMADYEAWLIDPVAEWAVLSESAYNLLELFAKLYNEVGDENWQLDFNPAWPWLYQYDIWNQIKSEMTLEKMVEARSNEIWFWQVTEWEWKMLREAATSLWSAYWTRDSKINDEVNWLVSALWHATYWENNDVNPEKWNEFRNNVKKLRDWNDVTEVWDTLWWIETPNLGGGTWEVVESINDAMDTMFGTGS